MCNLYRMTGTVDEIAGLFGPLANPGANLPSFGEIYPDNEAPVLRREGPESEALTLAILHWGVPGFGKVRRPITNVRNLQSSFWRDMLSSPDRRCLVPVSSFCEWAGEKGSKRKIWFGLEDRPLFAFAGIWRPSEDGERFAFLTCAPNDTVGAVHPQAMPVILAPEDHATWLAADYATITGLARPYPDAGMAIVEGEP